MSGGKHTSLQREFTKIPADSHHIHCCPGDEPGWQHVAQSHGIQAKGLTATMASLPGQFTNFLASFVVAGNAIFTIDSVIGSSLTVMYTFLYWHYGKFLSVNMSWNIVSLAVIFPISQAIGMGFKRREAALMEFGNLLGNLRAVWGAAHTWRIKNSEGAWVRVCEQYIQDDTHHDWHSLFEEFLTALITYFNVPRAGRARHTVGCGRSEEEEVLTVTHEQRLRVDSCLGRMQMLVQDFKANGLAGGEAHRLDQYLSKVGIAFERLTNLKEYRTPQAFRAFARVYILIIGALYGPYYVYLAKGDSKTEDNIGLAIAFAVGTQLAMSGLYNVMLGLEDPFSRRGGRGQIDSVKVPELVEVTRQQLNQIEKEAVAGWSRAGQKSHPTGQMMDQ